VRLCAHASCARSPRYRHCRWSRAKKVLNYAGIHDCFTSSTGGTKTLGNFVKATFDALAKTYSFLSPDLWAETKFLPAPNQEFTDFLAQSAKAKVHH